MEATLIGPSGRTTLDSAVVTIGRMPGSKLLMTDPQSSAHHAELRSDVRGYFIIDLGSTNGTYVNEELLARQSPRLLVAGDRIRIGDTVFQYEVSGSPLMAPTMYAGLPGQNSAPAFEANARRGYAPSPPPPPVYQQPYPFAAPPHQYPPPVRKKSRRGLWIALALVALLLVVGAAVIIASANRPAPDRTLAAFCSGLKARDYQGAYQQLSTGARGRVSETKFAATFDGVGGVKDCTFGGIKQNSSTSTALLTLTLNVSFVPPRNYDITLINENGGWKIDTFAVVRA
jgi:FHA domain-containing protein